jgi:shikimate kinase
VSEKDLLFLIGYRGSGKTTVARLLAKRLGWNWLDADQALEERHGRTVREIFASEGETGFRDKESTLLAELCTRRRHVIATGGGVVLRSENRDLMGRSGRIVWLSADPHTLWQRIQTDTSTAGRRPDLSCGGLAEVQRLLHDRTALYQACAHLSLDTTKSTPEDIAETIVEWLEKE